MSDVQPADRLQEERLAKLASTLNDLEVALKSLDDLSLFDAGAHLSQAIAILEPLHPERVRKVAPSDWETASLTQLWSEVSSDADAAVDR